MKKAQKILLIIIPIIVILVGIALAVVIFTREQPLGHQHHFTEWETVVEATCTQEGKQSRYCTDCHAEEVVVIPATWHSYTEIKSIWDNTNYIESVCGVCGVSAGNVMEGGYSADGNTVYLYNCATDFAFDVICTGGEEQIRDNLIVVETIFSENTGDVLDAFSDDYSLSKIDDNIWRVSPVNPYLEKTGYTVILGEGVSIAHFLGKQLNFRTQGNASDIVEYSNDIVFLKQLEEENPGYSPYTVDFDAENGIMLLTLSQQGAFTDDMIDKILCIGDCASIDEIDSYRSDNIEFGRVQSIDSQGDKTVITLSAVGFEDIYSAIDVTLGDKQPIVYTDLTDEEKIGYAYAILNNSSFHEAAMNAIATANNYALEIGGNSVEADWEGFVGDLWGTLGITATKMPEVGNKHKVKINVGTVAGDENVELTIKIKRNGRTISKVKLSFVLKEEIIVTMDGNVTKNNIKEYIKDQFNFFNDDDVVAYFYTEFVTTNITTFKTKISFSLELGSETIYYVVTPNTKKIHSCSCVYASGYDDDDDVYYTLTEIKKEFGEQYKEHQCKKCIPFSDSKFFGVNKETGVVHCMGGQCVENMDMSKIYQCVFLPKAGEEFSNGIKYTYCSVCKPLNKAENSEAGVAYSFDDYIQDGFKEGNWDTEFKFLSKVAFERLGIDTSRDIDFDQTKPVALWGIVELRIGVYPLVDINAQGSAEINYVDVAKKKHVIEIKHDPQTGKTYKNIHAEDVELSSEEKGLSEFTVDFVGSIEAKSGIRNVLAVGVAGLGKWFNINVSADVGVFVDAKGILHINFRDSEKNEDFHGGYCHMGVFVEISAGGTIAGKQFKIASFVDEEVPFITVGDSIIYYGYCDYEQEIELINQNTYEIDGNSLYTVFYNLEKLEKDFKQLNPKGVKGDYSIKYIFVDEDGNQINYCNVKNGVLNIDSSAPSNFEINMIVLVTDEDPADWDDLLDNGWGAELGTSYQLPELTIKIKYVSDSQPIAEKTEIAPATHPSGLYLTGEEITFNVTANTECVYGMALYCNGNRVDVAYANEMVLANGKQTVALQATFGSAGTHTIEARPLNEKGVPIQSSEKGATVTITIHDRNLCTAPQITTPKDQTISTNQPFHIAWTPSAYPTDGITYSIVVDYRGSDPWEYPLSGVSVEGTSYTIDGSVFSKPGRYGITVYPVSSDLSVKVPDNCYSVIGINVTDETGVVPVTGITLSITEVELEVGQLQVIIATLVPANASNTSIQWNSLDNSVVGIDIAVDDSTIAVLHPKSVGTAIVTATTGDGVYAATCTVTVIGSAPDYVSEGLTYELNSDGTGYIVTGIGTCTDAKISIPATYEGLPILGIGDRAFYNCAGLTGITIPDSVTSIGSEAFYLCTGLTNITIPDSVTFIDYWTFGFCTSLTSIMIPDSVRTIEWGGFYHCTGLTSITIPDSVTYISNIAFAGCTGLASITVDEDNPQYHSVNNCLIESATNTLLLGCKTSMIPNGVTSIGDHAFRNCEGLTSIMIPDSVTSVGVDAFRNCEGLTSIMIPNSVTSISDGAFWGCTDLASITMPDSVTSIGRHAFEGCTSLTSITISDSLTSIGADAFLRCTSLTDVYYTGTKKEWVAITIGTNNTYLTNATIHYNWVDADHQPNKPAENASVGLEYALNEEQTGYIVTGIGTCVDTEIVIPDRYEGLPVVAIGYGAFNWCNNLLYVTIPDSVTSIGDYAFRNCNNMTSIKIPDSVTSIGENAFMWCGSLTSITIPNSVKIIDRDAFSHCTSLTSVTMGDGVTYIGYSAFSACTSLTSITIPNSVTIIDNCAFLDCTSLTSIVIPDSVTSIGQSVFNGCTSLTSAVIGDSVTIIGNNAFEDCINLTSVTIGDSVTTIANCVFLNCSSLTSVTIPDSVQWLPNAFRECSSLTSITLPESMQSLSGTFIGCSSLTSINIPNSVQDIGLFTFWGCTNLTSIKIPDGVTYIGRGTFEDCLSLTSITIPDSVKNIVENAFYNCTDLTDIYYSGTEEEWAAIYIGTNNECLDNATIHYNWTGE